MSDIQLVVHTMERYMDLLRIENAKDPQKEIGNQKRELEAVLKILGIPAEKLYLD